MTNLDSLSLETEVFNLWKDRLHIVSGKEKYNYKS